MLKLYMWEGKWYTQEELRGVLDVEVTDIGNDMMFSNDLRQWEKLTLESITTKHFVSDDNTKWLFARKPEICTQCCLTSGGEIIQYPVKDSESYKEKKKTGCGFETIREANERRAELLNNPFCGGGAFREPTVEDEGIKAYVQMTHGKYAFLELAIYRNGNFYVEMDEGILARAASVLVRYKPQTGDTYHYQASGAIYTTTDMGSDEDTYRLSVGNYFDSQEAAAKYRPYEKPEGEMWDL